MKRLRRSWTWLREFVDDLKNFRREIEEEVDECVFHQLDICECKWTCKLEMDKFTQALKAKKSWD